MIKGLFTLIISLCTCFTLYSQSVKADTIYLIDSEVIVVQIIDFNDSRIKYRKLNTESKTSYTLIAEDIIWIHMSDGEIIRNRNGILTSSNKDIKESPEKESSFYAPVNSKENNEKRTLRVQRSTIYNQRKNMIGFNYASFITLDLEFSYERILDKVGYIGLKIPIKFNMGVKPKYLNKHNIFTSGIHVNIYPLGQGRFSYFTGPVIHIKIMDDNEEYVSLGSNPISITLYPARSTYLGFYMNNGCLFRANPFLYFGLSLGFGFRRDLARQSENSIFDVIGETSIKFRF